MVSILVYFHHSFDDDWVYWLFCMVGDEFTYPIKVHDLRVGGPIGVAMHTLTGNTKMGSQIFPSELVNPFLCT
tara:strand:+ start:3411 stop:3629 length:219 start_codon:yes stop_codon:yes gene_type:complete